VVFFGETVPAERVALAYQALGESDAILVVGSSLTVFSGYRFVRRAWEAGQPIVVVNAGVTRADPLAQLKVQGSCATLLDSAITCLGG
jgi:NAD-dependent SIR2 family protein deacetylase